MDYKSIIKSRKVRLAILRAFNWIPDKTMLKLQYWIKTGNRLDLKNPIRYTEKLQWYKLYYRDPLMAKCSDKASVREYVEEKGLSSILNESYGVYNNIFDINFSLLPQKFVMKDTLGGGGNSVVICEDKQNINLDKLKITLQQWLNIPKKGAGREWVYTRNKSRIIIEKYIESDRKNGGLVDYKFFCFQGKVKYIYVIADRKIGEKAGLGIFNTTFTQIPFYRLDENPLNRIVPKPANYELMIKYAEILAKDFPHVRVDMYNLNGWIIFGELTFFDGSGYMKFDPDEFDLLLGKEFQLSAYKDINK